MKLKSVTGKNLLWLSLITMLIMSVAMINVTSASPETHFYVDPPEVSGVEPPDGKFLIQIRVAEAPDTFAWTISLSWDPDLLELVYEKEGDFLKNAHPVTSYVFTPLDEANLIGMITISCSIVGDPNVVPWASGDGWLCNLGFEVEDWGSCVLNLFDTRLYDHTVGVPPVPQPTDYPNLDGFFYNVETGTISGTVTDEDTLLPIEGATVSADAVSDVTDSSGFYSLEVSPGTYDVTAEMTDYVSQTAFSVPVAADQTVTQDFALSPARTRAHLARRSAWPEHHHYSMGKAATNYLFAIVRNDGNEDTWVKVVFTVSKNGVPEEEETFNTTTMELLVDEMYGHKRDARYWAEFEPTWGYGKYYVSAQCWADTNGDTVPDTPMGKTKTFSFNVVA